MKELASAVGKSEKVVVRDLQRLIENRAFTNGHLTGEVAESDGMVCGGVMYALIEDGTEM